jgi:Na+/H+ antiporter NhaD/arsenite permease-like protein
MFTFIVIIFIAGYVLISTEHMNKVNKAATALITGVLCWTVYIVGTPDKDHVSEQLSAHMGELSGILFFLMGAMAIVELIDAHKGFTIITDQITITDKRKLLWLLSFITFFLSAALDNLTSTIVMVTLLNKLLKDRSDKLLFIGMIIIASNAGGAWSPIGDVTTTMLWIGGQITALNVIKALFIPSVVCLLTPLIFLSFQLKGEIHLRTSSTSAADVLIDRSQQRIVFFSGIVIILLVPVFKTVTHLPPYMGMLLGLGILWVITEIIHGQKDDDEREALSVAAALQKIDTPSILFFLGILVSVAALQVSGILGNIAFKINAIFPNVHYIPIIIGMISSIVDNVPLVAASQGMYPLTQFPTDHSFWEFLAYTTGTGGSLLIIGSAAGVAAMGMEKLNFFWYFNKISLLALFGYAAGIGAYLLQEWVFT